MKLPICLLFFVSSLITLGQVVSTANDISDYAVRYRNLKQSNQETFFRDLNWHPKDSMDFIGSSPQSKPLGKNLYLHPFKWDSYFNTAYNKSYNNGAVWSGKGLTTSIETGLSLKNERWEFTLLPIIFWTQNLDYDSVPLNYTQARSEFAYPWSHYIDLPQRFGDQSFYHFNLGNSKIQYTFKNNLYFRVSNESLWWGPTYLNPALMSNNAAGIPHFAFGSDEKISTKYGTFTFNLIWGILSESDYFNDDSSDDYRLLTSLNLAWEPWFTDGLELGFARSLQRIWDLGDMGVKDYVAMIIDPERRLQGDNDSHDQIAMAYLRWRFPLEGFELFTELGRYDWGGHLKNFLVLHPDHSLVYSFGFSKLFPIQKGDLRFLTEFNVLSKSRLAQNRVAPTIYEHFLVQQGYTQLGETIGASIGPGSTSQMFRIDVFKKKSVTSYTLVRSTLQDDAFFALEAGIPQQNRSATPEERDIELSLTFSHYRNWSKFQLGFEIGHYVRENRNLTDNSYNLHLKLSVKKPF